MNSAYLPDESTSLLNSVIKLLRSGDEHIHVEDMVMMVYNLGKMDGRMEQLDRNEAIVRETIGEGRAS